MVKEKLFIIGCVFIVIFTGCVGCSKEKIIEEEQPKRFEVKVGAYYFHGWSGKTDMWHLPTRLKIEFGNREPLWGWYTNTVELMEQQIDYAADNGLNFFSFCWFNSTSIDGWIQDALNEGLNFYLESSNRNRLEFSIFVSNHDEGWNIGPNEWDYCTDKWIELFMEDGYLKVDGRPVIIFMRHDLLLKKWGSVENLENGFKEFKLKANRTGLKSPLIGIVALPGPQNGWHNLLTIKQAGYDFFTGYSYGNDISADGSTLEQPFENLLNTSKYIWNLFGEKNVLPYAPIVTGGWDMRPWETGEPKAYYYTGRTAEKISHAVQESLSWVKQNPDKTFNEPFITIYAWNENGEGGYLTPTKTENDSVLKAIRSVLD